MDGELLLILGIVVGVLATPALISAFSSGRSPRGAIVAAVAGGSLIFLATLAQPGGFRAQDLPQIAARVLHRYLP